MNRTLLIVLASLFAGAFALQAQSNALSSEIKQSYKSVKNNLLKAAEKMPEENYSFQPVPEIRTFGALVAHIADAQTRFCTVAMGEPKTPSAGSKKTKADLVAALKESIADCDKAFEELTDAAATQMVKMGRNESTKMGALVRNVIHDNEEYGYLAVYLRLKNIVPPSSEGR
jgi:uncharacterized damage-inducible protein DinB